jgi:glyoxylase-like metal-dependent hydrolase (beta-lactamase superfamily II)
MMALKYRVFLHSYLGFNSNSTFVYGEKDAILIDASQCLSDSHRMAAEIILSRKNLTHIYVSHFHPDHHFGLEVLHSAFPRAKVVALPTVVRDIAFTSSDKVDMWAIDRFGPDIPSKTFIPVPMHDPRLEVEGEEILFYGEIDGDSIDNSVAWIPSLKVICATDVASHDCHLWPVESNVERRKRWRAEIGRLMDFDPRIVIPGHCDAARVQLLHEIQEDPSRSYTDCVDWSIKYLDDYEEVYNTASTGAEMVDMMFKLYPGIKAMDFAIHWTARLLFPRTAPDWLTPLPGPPGQIFLNPFGVFDGDPPKE